VIKFRIEILYEFVLLNYESFTLVTIELISILHQIEEFVFAENNSKRIQIPALIEMMCKSYFSNYKSFTFVIFESNSKLQ
jgi:hypothetical protein